MKYTLILLLILNTLSSSAQSKLDSLVLIKVNDYRKSLGLNKVQFDINCFKAAQLQANYQKTNRVCGHTQKDFQFETMEKRLKYFGSSSYLFAGEVCSIIPMNSKTTDTLSYDKLATKIVEAWKKSILHNQILTDSNYNFCGVCCELELRSNGIQGWINFNSFNSMEFIDKR